MFPTPKENPENKSVPLFNYPVSQLTPNTDVNRTIHMDMVSSAELRYFQQNIKKPPMVEKLVLFKIRIKLE